MKDFIWIFITLCVSNAFEQPIRSQIEQNPLCPLDENPLNPTNLPNENDCGQFYKCYEGYAYPMSCIGEQHWSAELNRCEHPNVANCQQKESRALSGSGNLNDACPLDEDPNNPTLLTYPGDCRKFYKCSFGRAYILTCPYGLHWDMKSNRCESPFVAKCGEVEVVTPSTTKSTSSTPSTTPSTTPQCSDPSSVQKFGIPGQCKQFFQCSKGNLHLLNCREGREWSVTANDCVNTAIAGCSGTSGSVTSSSTTKTTTTTTTTTPKPTQAPTSCTPGVEYLSHPTDCNKFYQCDNGRPIEKQCSPGLFWSKSIFNCDWSPNDCR